jgi:uncharacterized FAD-dependent dehydrogenase
MGTNLNINNQMEKKKIVVVGGGVSGICAITKLVDNGYPGELITVIDKGSDPYVRKPEEVMTGFMGCGLWSDGKLTYHTAIGGVLSKYCGEDKAMELMDQVIQMVTRFHPDPSQIMKSDPQEEPDFIKPHFGLRLFPVYHIGTDYLHEIGKRWYDYLVDKGVKFYWNLEVENINFEKQQIYCEDIDDSSWRHKYIGYDKLIFAVGKSGIDFGKQLADCYNLPTEPKSVQIGVRFEAPQKYFQKLIDVSYDFKLYQKFDNVSLRSFCTNNNAAYVAVENTYGDVTFNGHAKKGEEFRNNMTNFGILMEIKGIENPFEWSRDVVSKLQMMNTGLYYSPNIKNSASKTSEGNKVNSYQIVTAELNKVRETFGGYFEHIENFIDQMNKVFEFGDDWGMYIPEVKYLSPEPLVDYKNLALVDYPNVHFVGDALSARGITVSGAHGIYCSEYILRESGIFITK